MEATDKLQLLEALIQDLRRTLLRLHQEWEEEEEEQVWGGSGPELPLVGLWGISLVTAEEDMAVGEEGTEVTGVEVTPVVTPLGGTLGGALPARAEPLAEGEVADPLPLVPPQVLEEPAGGKVQDQSDCKKTWTL